MITKKRAIFSGIFVILSLLFFFLANNGLGKFDEKSNEYFESSLKKAAISYATVRGVNSIVSVIKESKVDMAPAGVGLSVAAGQVLDPLDDMTERVSDVLVMAIVALGIEKIFFEIVSGYGFTVLAIIALCIALVPLLPLGVGNRAYVFFLKLMTVVLVLRLLLPISATLSQYFHDTIFSEKIERSKLVLSEISSKEIPMEIPKTNDSFLEKIKNSYSQVSLKSAQIAEVFSNIKNNMSDIITALVELTTVYVFSFLLEVILIPVGVFLFIFKGLKVFFRYEL